MTRTQLLVKLENENCVIGQENQGQVVAFIPGWDSGFAAMHHKMPFMRHFWDKAVITPLDVDRHLIQLIYWTPSRTVFHAILSIVVFVEFYANPALMNLPQLLVLLAFVNSFLPAAALMEAHGLFRRLGSIPD